MTHTDTSISRESLLTPQSLHREAAVELEKALKHHRQAVLLHDAGDARQAETQGGLAYSHTAQALQVSGRALNENERDSQH
ncbi:MAG TPA: hypothetical protein VIM63_17970 [Rhodoferax sp.]